MPRTKTTTHSSAHWGCLLLATVLALAACSDDPECDGADCLIVDAGTQTDSGAGPTDSGTSGQATVQAGIGQDAFVDLAGGEVVDIIAGPQGGGRYGGHHIWSAVRAVGFNTSDRLRVTYTISSTTGVVQASQVRDFQFLPDGTGGYVLFGLAPRLDDCCRVANGPIVMAAEVVDVDGLTRKDEVQVTASRCPAVGQDACL